MPGVVSTIWLPGAAPVGGLGRARRFLRHRHDGPAKRSTLVLESHCGEHMRSQRLLRILDPDRAIEQRREALTHEEPARFAAHENGDRDGLSRCDCRPSGAWSLEIGDLLRVGIGRQRGMHRRGRHHGVIRTGSRRLRADRKTAFGFAAKRRGLAISTGRISSGAMITRVPRLVRCHSRTAKSLFRRIQPCEAGYPGTTPACSAIPDHVMRCI